MKYPKRVRDFRRSLQSHLRRLAKRGCGDGGWCECLLCRVMRIVRTEQFRNAPVHKSSFPSSQAVGKKTRMCHWRGGLIEFAIGSEFESIADPPWYAVKMVRHGDMHEWIWWLDYGGPPQLYLTRKAAEHKAKGLRKQYGSYYKSIRVVKVGILE